jgi:predicted dehydrogenase
MKPTDQRVRHVVSRRTVLRGAVAAGAFSIVPPHVLGQDRDQPSPSKKITFAAVGAAGQAGSDIEALTRAGGQLVACADVDGRRAAAAAQRYPQAKKFVDYREMLDAVGDKADAVLVAVPDHCHAVAAMAAIKAKKHVYCEKPLAHSVWEVRALMKAAREHGVITQLGNQGHSFPTIRLFREWVEDGAIGAVHTIHAGCNASNSRIDQVPLIGEKHEVPPDLDWDKWLGPAAFRPYNPMYLPAKWRSWRAFGTGTIGDWTCHVIDPVFWTLDLGAPDSIKVEKADGWDPEKHRETFPRGSVTRFVFPARGSRGPVTLLWHDGAEAIPAPDIWPDVVKETPDRKLVDTGALVYGDKGVIMYGSHGATGVRIIPQSAMAAYTKPPQTIPRAPLNDHYRDFIEAVRDGRKAGSDFSYGGPLTEIALVGAIAQLFPGQELKWDGPNMRFTNSSEATGLLTPKFREGWNL